jgi:hypothetical protein
VASIKVDKALEAPALLAKPHNVSIQLKGAASSMTRADPVLLQQGGTTWQAVV